MSDVFPDVQSVRKKLKEWESAFYVVHRRKPSKEDIDQAPSDIKEKYKTYAQLKKGNVIQKANEEIPDESGVWGAEFNKKPCKSRQESDESNHDKTSSLAKLSSKLFFNASSSSSKDMKKSKNKHLVRDTSSVALAGTSTSLSSPHLDTLEEERNLESSKHNDFDSHEQFALSGSIFKRARKMTHKNISNVSSKHVEPIFGMKYGIHKKLSISGSSVDITRFENTDLHDLNEKSLSPIADLTYDSTSCIGVQSESSHDLVKEKQFENMGSVSSNVSINEEIKISDCTMKASTSKKQGSDVIEKDVHNEEEAVGAKRKADTSKEFYQPSKKAKSYVDNKGDADAHNDPQSSLIEEKDSQQKKMDSEYSAGKSSISSSKKRLAASMNENYVCLNMKKKGYRRKGAGMTGVQLKRKQWKAKMAARSESYGSNKCFKCGQEGHWANKCRGKGKSQFSSEDQQEFKPVEESGFPTLRNAALMARGVKSTEQ